MICPMRWRYTHEIKLGPRRKSLLGTSYLLMRLGPPEKLIDSLSMWEEALQSGFLSDSSRPFLASRHGCVSSPFSLKIPSNVRH